MSLIVYNTKSGKKEAFKPLREGHVGMYVCGVTVYDLCHVGHARAGVVFDIIYRYLKHIGYEVCYVRNFTDVDDKIINRANEKGVSSEEIAEKYIVEFDRDMGALGLEDPTEEPKATEHIEEMIALIEGLIEKGLAYAAGGDVFYAVRKFDEYGKLSNRQMDDLIAGARVAVGEHKEDPLDFALWKASKPGEPMWDSPWGKGRPGWHIECSAMGKKYLGETFDIHGGGRDLVFPHHENERAQSFGCTGKEPVRYWVHNGFVNINKEKMSKSLGNFFTIREILQEFDGEVLRFFLLTSHYRSPIDFSDQSLKEAKTNLDRFYHLFQEGAKEGSLEGEGTSDLIQKFEEAMNDDFNTASAIGHLNTELRNLNGLRKELNGDKEKGKEFKKRVATLRKVGGVLGLFQQDPSEYFQKGQAERLREQGISEEEIEALIEKRIEARKNKDWSEADRIRDHLAAKGITLLDNAEGTGWQIKG